MSGIKSSLIEQLTNSIMCLMTVVPIAWLLDKQGILGISLWYFMFYFMALVFSGILSAAIGNTKMIYKIAPVIPVMILVVFRDLELFANVLAAFIIYLVLTQLYKCRKRRPAMTIMAVVLTALCDSMGNMPKAVAAALIGIILLSISSYVTKHMKYAVTLVVVIECFVLLIHMDTAPLMWKPLSEGGERIWSVVDNVMKKTEYQFGAFDNVSYTGYGEPGGMFKGVTYRYREELNVDVVGKITMLYLKGASYANITKDGVSGKVIEDTADNGWFAIYLNALYNAGITKEEAASFSKLLKVNVEYEYMQTDDVMRSSNLLLIDDGADGDNLSKNHRYSFNYVALDYANPYLDAVIRSASSGNMDSIGGVRGYGTSLAYDYYYQLSKMEAGEGKITKAPYFMIKDYAYKLYNIKLENIMDKEAYEQAFIKYEEDLNAAKYLEDSLVTDRIRELAEEVTKDSSIDYDKARNIEAFLRQYSYDTSVDLRGSDNFIEAFLFEKQSGYCAHYATAMVEMLRSVGIPARYTQGYRHITDKGEMVYSNEANAWPEAFIKGIGWVPFEPTVIFVSAPESGWGLRPVEKNRKQEEIEGYDPKAAVPPSDVETQQKKAGQTGDDGSDGTGESDVKTGIMDIVRHAGIYILGMIGVVLVFFMIYRLYEIIRYSRMSLVEKVYADIGMIGRKCDRYFEEGNEAKSVFDYIPHIKQVKTDYDLNELFGEYYRIRFRGDTPSTELVQKLHEVAKNI